ncbi:hypothetical protein Gotri_016114 [Gossypium trilobum]|uniref:Peptidase M20 dimerisation domain-containing protein n=1 Tax=Gossypium trilobum TaxID=34281 RepID=A0A7J9E2C5_9ROSI|nr:hypothetical protein [Gossypium trilobum]
MSWKFFVSHSLPLFFLFFFYSFPLISTQHNDDPTFKTMHDFSGYPVDESSHTFTPSNSISLSVDIQALQKQIDELSTFSDTPAPSVTRILYTENDVLARRYVKNLMGLAGLSVTEDVVGNIFGRCSAIDFSLLLVSSRHCNVTVLISALHLVLTVFLICILDGNEPELTAVATGSHIDAIPYSGKYDGVVGVLGAIEAINALKRSGFKPKRSLEIILFTSEEPTRFGIGCLGSRLLAGSEALAEALKTTVDGQNISFLEAARSAGYARDEDDLSSVFLKNDSYSAFVELHIEQAPILEEEGISIGVVTNIAAPASIKVDFEGNGGHAGGVLMPDRNDAGLAAAELMLAIEKHATESGSLDTVGTVGILELYPGAINSIPSKAHLEIGKSLEGHIPVLIFIYALDIGVEDGYFRKNEELEQHDVRDIEESFRNAVINKIHKAAKSIAKKRKVTLSEFKIINQDPPAHSNGSVIKAVVHASGELNLTYKYMISRAYHDSLFMARWLWGMFSWKSAGILYNRAELSRAQTRLNIQSLKLRYSHKPEEYASPQDIENGVKVLALTLAKLSLR